MALRELRHSELVLEFRHSDLELQWNKNQRGIQVAMEETSPMTSATIKTKHRTLMAINWFLATVSSEVAGTWQWVLTVGWWHTNIPVVERCWLSSSRSNGCIWSGKNCDDSPSVSLIGRMSMFTFCFRRCFRSLNSDSSLRMSYCTSESTHLAILRDTDDYIRGPSLD